MPLRRPLVALLLLSAASAACAASSDEDDPLAVDGEPAGEAAASALTDQSLRDESRDDGPGFTPLALSNDVIDVRGVGDSAWTRTHVSPAPAPGFGAALDEFDRSGNAYRGHINFINWESVIADACTSFSKPYVAGRQYAFVSRAENVKQAMDRGFNLIGLANNHTRDCTKTPEGYDGIESTRRAARDLATDTTLFHGVGPSGDERKPKLGRFSIGGRNVKVAFADVYLGIPRAGGVSCLDDAEPLMKAMKESDADLRILAMHSVDDANQNLLADVGARFVTEFGGDVVFGSGPHVWRPVKVLRKPNGKPGVVFESLGNFLDPALAAQPKNFIGRAVFDKESLALTQVQLLAVENRGEDIRKSTADLNAVGANLRWKKAPGDFPVVYSNIKP